MSAEKIIEQIKKDSEKEIKQISKETDDKIKELINSAKKEAKEEADKILNNAKKQGENLKKVLISKAYSDSKREIMNAREEIIEECFLKARHELATLTQEKYIDLVSKFINIGIKKLGTNCQVKISRDIDKKIAENFGLKVIGNIESSGGVLLISADNKITLDYTFEGIMKREKDKIRIKIGKFLFS
ncbi:MAG: V-type ATP synthase subunit E [Thermoplasmatota archaeon]|jgi:vacuolar-type H+-ATPase subunit E/Vma4